jgi:hypothetical protein
MMVRAPTTATNPVITMTTASGILASGAAGATAPAVVTDAVASRPRSSRLVPGQCWSSARPQAPAAAASPLHESVIREFPQMKGTGSR